ncbi:MAG: penicillin-binding protein activator [Roseovarius sp.]|nr:penicillin-binding protein activator [Roseovarius sp.]
MSFRAFFALLTAICLSACVPEQPSGKLDASNASVQVALLVPYGSEDPSEASLASDMENAARLAIADISGVKIDIRVYDTNGNALDARSAALKAAEDGADIIVGPLHAESANAVAVAVAPRRINVLAFSNNETIAGGNLYIMGQTFYDTANRLVEYAVEQGKSRILIVHSNTLSGRLGRDAIEKAIADNGAYTVGSVGHDFSQQGVIDSIPEIKAAVEETAADTVFLTATSTGGLPLFSQMLPEAGLGNDMVQHIGLTRWDRPPRTLDLPGIEGGWFAMPDQVRDALFKAKFNEATGTNPHTLAGLSYDAISAIGALAISGRTGALTQPAGFQGVTGIFRFRSNRTIERGLSVATVEDRMIVELSPAPQSFGGTGF